MNQMLTALRAARLRDAGGSGSGNFGHAGRPGEVGGSGPGGGAATPELGARDRLDARAQTQMRMLPDGSARYVRKPSDWEDARSMTATAAQKSISNLLRRYTVRDAYGSDYAKPLRDFKQPMPNYFVISHSDGGETLVSTEGANYARYTAKLK